MHRIIFHSEKKFGCD